MTDSQLLNELAERCRKLAVRQQSVNVLDMLHDLEEDFMQKTRKSEGEELLAARK